MMALEIFEDIEQGSPEWKALRSGLVSASEFGAMLAKGEGKMRRGLMLRLAGERITGEPEETYENSDMRRGREMEAEARNLYAMRTTSNLRRVAFIKNHGAGCSPDTLVDENGGAEFKSNKPSVLIEVWEKGVLDWGRTAAKRGDFR